MKKITCLLLFTFWGTLLYSQNMVVDGVTFSADGKTLIKYPKDKVDEEYVVPEGTQIIETEAFDQLGVIFPRLWVGIFFTNLQYGNFMCQMVLIV